MQAHFAKRHAEFNAYGRPIRSQQAKVATIQTHDSVVECVEGAVKARERVVVALKVAQDLAAATAKAPGERPAAVVKVAEDRAAAIVTAAEDRAAAIVRAAEDRASAIIRAAYHDASLSLHTVTPPASSSSANKLFHPPTRFPGASTCFPGVSLAASHTTSTAPSAATSLTASTPFLSSSRKRIDPPTGITQPPDPKRRATSASSSSKSHILNDE